MLAVSGCQSRDITPEWWKILPGSFLDWKEPLTQVLALLLPWAIVIGVIILVQGLQPIMDQGNMGTMDCLLFLAILFVIGFVIPFLGVLALGLFGLILLEAFSYGFTGIQYYTSYMFACYYACYLVLALTLIYIFSRLKNWLSDVSVLKKSLGLIGLILEGFGILFTIRDIYHLIVK